MRESLLFERRRRSPPDPARRPGERPLRERPRSGRGMSVPSETRRGRRRRARRGRAPPQARRPRGVSSAVARRVSPPSLPVSRVLVALVRAADVREARQEASLPRSCRLRRRSCCSARGCRAPAQPVEDRAVAAGDRADLDVRDVVRKPPSVREALQVAREARQSVPASAVGAMAVFSRSRSACVAPVKLSPGTPVSSTATRSLRSVVGVSGSTG